MTVEQVYEDMRTRLSNIAPDVELKIKAEYVHEIERLKKEKNAVILGHNYMEPVLFHTVPDFTGDSLYLSRVAAETDADVIVFCGVRFMAETAKILNPDKMVLLPAKKAGCSLAESITAEDVRWLRSQFPGVPVVSYVNTYADVKAESDICCTSGNAVAVVNSMDSDLVIFLPDEFLAQNVAKETGKKIIFPTRDGFKQSTGEQFDSVRAASSVPGLGEAPLRDGMVGWHGRCEVHDKFTVEDITNIRKQYPEVVILAHPECSPEVVEASDYAGSTSAMINYVEETAAPHYLLLTECSMGDNIAAANPEKEMLRLCMVRCPHMNEITLEDTMYALQRDQYQIDIPEDIRVRAEKAVQRMIEIG